MGFEHTFLSIFPTCHPERSEAESKRSRRTPSCCLYPFDTGSLDYARDDKQGVNLTSRRAIEMFSRLKPANPAGEAPVLQLRRHDFGDG